jgi:hypothetical protein
VALYRGAVLFQNAVGRAQRRACRTGLRQHSGTSSAAAVLVDGPAPPPPPPPSETIVVGTVAVPDAAAPAADRRVPAPAAAYRAPVVAVGPEPARGPCACATVTVLTLWALTGLLALGAILMSGAGFPPSSCPERKYKQIECDLNLAVSVIIGLAILSCTAAQFYIVFNAGLCGGCGALSSAPEEVRRRLSRLEVINLCLALVYAVGALAVGLNLSTPWLIVGASMGFPMAALSGLAICLQECCCAGSKDDD